MIFTTLKIAQAIINPCRTLETMTMMVVAKEVNKANSLRIAVIVLSVQSVHILILAGHGQPGGSQLNLAAIRTQRDQRRGGRNIVTGDV
jgi:hypothetical protein